MTTTRRTGAVSAATLFGLAALFVLAHSVAPAWAARLGLDVWNVPSLNEQLRQTDEDRQALLLQEERLFREMEVAQHLAVLLVDGALTLDEATDELEPILAERPGFDATCRITYGVSTLRQGVARYLLARVEHHLQEAPSQLATVCCRLESEYAAIR